MLNQAKAVLSGPKIPTISQACWDIMKLMLPQQIKDQITAEQALQHPFLMPWIIVGKPLLPACIVQCSPDNPFRYFNYDQMRIKNAVSALQQSSLPPLVTVPPIKALKPTNSPPFMYNQPYQAQFKDQQIAQIKPKSPISNERRVYMQQYMDDPQAYIGYIIEIRGFLSIPKEYNNGGIVGKVFTIYRELNRGGVFPREDIEVLVENNNAYYGQAIEYASNSTVSELECYIYQKSEGSHWFGLKSLKMAST
ncbi:MAG: hypothetical protein EZS28_008090 [Streblomastix strix]|uniref:Protein kinase domain-containing protein n=1 Tax=Streblomastix strix TaxID=222440 RepID=A0A5J4WNJ8_9EUKA|nr:MAG: hypothetical protein EZS28_008090 [Streblomastix strix]